MKATARAFATLISAVAAFYFVFWVLFGLLYPADLPEWVPLLGSFLIAVLVGRSVWKGSVPFGSGFFTSVGVGAFVTGCVGFTIGFFGPILFTPGANQGPLLGIFITGPLGILLGGMGGGIYWAAKSRARRADRT
jgi:hypothetical protein